MEELFYLWTFFEQNSVSSLIISLIVAAIVIVLDLTIKGFNPFLRAISPFLIATLLAVAYDMIWSTGAFILRADALYSGLLCGSLASVLRAIVAKIRSGDSLALSPTEFLIDGILDGYFKGDIKVAAVQAIAAFLEAKDDLENKNVAEKLTEEISAVLKEYAKDGLDEAETNALARLILQATRSLRNN